MPPTSTNENLDQGTSRRDDDDENPDGGTSRRDDNEGILTGLPQEEMEVQRTPIIVLFVVLHESYGGW